MSDITTRTGKGAALTHSELDDNFTNLNTDKAELSGADFTGNISVDGNISVTGTVDGRDVAADGTKLDGVEANADVTDTTNVVASLTAGTNITIAADGTISATDSDTVLTSEQVQDIVGAMVSGNTETGITVTYQDADGTIDFVVASQTDENFTTTLKNKLDAIEANADVTDTTNVVASLTAGTNVTIASDGTISATDTNTQLTTEQVQDIVGAMFSGNTETGIAVTYQDDDGTVDFVVTTQSDENFTTVLKNKLDGIEAGATADQTNAEIRAAVEAATDSNVFTDADHTKLDGIEANADVTDTDNVVASLTAGTNITISAGGVIASTASGGDLVDDTTPQLGGNLDLNSNNITGTGNINTTGDITVSGTAQSDDLNVGSSQQFTVSNIGKVTTSSYVDAGQYRIGATSVIDSSRNLENIGNITLAGTVDGRDVAADGTKLDGIAAGAEVNAVDSVNTQTGAVVLDADDISDSTTTNKFTTAGDITKLAGIEAGATADQTASEIRALVESATDSNVFTDADHTKLDAIEASADVTDTANVTAAGALMDSELTSEASVKALNQGVATTDSPTFAGIDVTGEVKGDSLEIGTNTDGASVSVTSAVTDFTIGGLTTGADLLFSYNRANGNTTISEGARGSETALQQWANNGDISFYNSAGTSQDLFWDASTSRLGLGAVMPSVSLDLGTNTDAVHVPVGTTAQRPSTPAAGYLRYNSTTGEFEGYTTAWAALGSDAGASNISHQDEIGNGSTTSFTLENSAAAKNNTQIYIDGVYQNKTSYSLTGGAIVFSEAPPDLSEIDIITIDPTTINEPADGSVTSAKLSGDLTTPGDLDVTGEITATSEITGARLTSTIHGNSVNTFGYLAGGDTDEDNKSNYITHGDTGVTVVRSWDGTSVGHIATFDSTGIDVTGSVTADSATIDGAVTINGAGINLDDAYSLTWGDGSAQVRGSGSSEAIDLRTSSTTRINIDADGDVSLYNSAGTSQDFYWDANTSRLGLGTDSPAYDLEIEGATNEFRISDTGANSTYARVATAANSATLQVGRQGGNFSVGSLVAKGNGSYLALDNVTSRVGVIESESNGDLSFSIDDGTTDKEFMRFDYSSGNVGIGVVGPSKKLEVTGGNLGSNLNDSVTHTRIRGSRHNLDFEEVRTVASSDWANTTYKLQMSVDTTKHQSIDFVSDSNFEEHIDIRTGNELFNTRFAADGNVGIGRVPSVKLDIQDTTDTSLRITATGTGASDDTLIRSQVLGTTASNYLWFGDADDINAGQIRYVHSDDSMRFSAGNTTDRLRLYSTDTIFYNGTTEIGRFNSSNNFGIGQPSPACRLHAYTASGNNIVRSESGDNYAAFQAVASGTNNSYIFFNNGSGETGRITSANGGAMVFYTSNTQERMRINSSGMDVTGTVAADAVTVGGNSVLTSVKSFKTFMTADATVNGSTTYTTKNVFNTTASINVGGFTVATSGVTVPEDGVYMVMANMMYNSTVVRVNPGFRFAINGTGQPEEALSAYIRSASGHNEASSSLSTMYNLSANDVIGLQFAQEGAAGTVNLETGSHIAIYRVS